VVVVTSSKLWCKVCVLALHLLTERWKVRSQWRWLLTLLVHSEIACARTIGKSVTCSDAWCVWLGCKGALSIVLAWDVLHGHITNGDWHLGKQDAVLDRRSTPSDGWRIELYCIDAWSVSTERHANAFPQPLEVGDLPLTW